MEIKKLLENIEEIWIFSEDIKNQVEESILKIKEKPYLADEILNLLNKNLEVAASKWVNISKYNDLIFNFRLTLLKSNISNFLSWYKNFESIWEYSIEKIENEYNDLVSMNKIHWEDRLKLDIEMKKLYEKSEIWKMFFKIKKLKNSDDLLWSEFDEIMRQILEYKEKWYDVSLLENEIMN